MRDLDQRIINVLKKYDGKGDQNPDLDLLRLNVLASITQKKPLQIVLFTCSTINSENMFNEQRFDLYVSLDPKGNNLEIDLPNLSKLYSDLNKLITVETTVLIGNTDPFYIYTQEGEIFSGISEQELLKKFSIRWAKYRINLEKSIKSDFPNLNIKVVSWYELERGWSDFGWDFRKQFRQVRKNIDKYFTVKEFAWELSKLKEAFGPDKYFKNLKRPPDSILKEWIRRKFAEYTVQGFWIKLIFPNAILLQNEKPSDLRTRMYQPLIKEKFNSRLPVLYPFGVDNSGYQ